MEKPPFSDGHGLNMAMQAVPPFEFEGMTVRAFPLRAKLNIVQQFCDGYLNFAPREVGYFRPFLPYVYLMLVNYGRMSVVVENSGWVAQRELCFTIPLEWYRREGGRLVFHDWAYLSPFIYVDSKLSMTTGREVYGWPKRIIRLDREGSHWMRDPRSPPNLASISAQVFSEAYAGRPQDHRVVIEIEQRQAPSLTEVPADLGSMFAPWVSLPRALVGSAGLMRDYAGVLAGLGLLRRHPGSSPTTYPDMARRLAQNLDFRDAALRFNTVNLKQFRSADDPAHLCYQALTNARMEFNRYNRGGLLGDVDMLYGDPSGGYRVFVHRFASEPVIESLGLEVSDEWRGDGVSVAALTPVFPFWLDVDAGYNLPETLAFRTKVSGWKDAEGQKLPPPEVRDAGPYPRFNTTLGAAQVQLGGPYDYPDSTLRVLPLLADPARLQAFCDAYLNDLLRERGMSFEAWGSYVYLVAANHASASSESNNVGALAGRDLTFYVPVKWSERGRLRTLALVPVFAYANTAIAAVSASEVNGVPTCKATMISPATSWMDDAAPESDQHHYLQMSTELLPAVGEGQRAEERVLVEVGDGLRLPATDAGPWRRVRGDWGAQLKRELGRRALVDPGKLEDGLALSLEILANRAPVEVVTVKQFRDGDDPYKACYQSLVQVRRTIQHVSDVREIEARLYVRVHEYPSHPIVQTLGLVAKTMSEGCAARVYELEPVRPFWLRAALREELGVTICSRAGSLAWVDDPIPPERRKEPGITPYFHGQPAVGRGLPGLVDDWAPQRLRLQAEEWRKRHGEEAMTVEQAQAAVKALEPQEILEAMLSREWESFGPSRWLEARDALTKQLQHIEQHALVQDGVVRQLDLIQREYEEAKRSTRRFEALADLDGEGGLLDRLRARAKELGQVQKTQDLALYLRDLAPGVAPLGESTYARQTVLSLREDEILALFASDAMIQVLEEALRVTDFPLDLPQPPPGTPPALQSWKAPVKRDELIRWLVPRLPVAGLLDQVAGQVEEIANGWHEWTRRELARLFVDDQGAATRALDALRQALTAAAPGLTPPSGVNDFLGWLWGEVGKDDTLVGRISDQAVRTAREQFAWARAAVVHKLAKTSQKPDFAFPVATLQTEEQGFAFPDEERWKDWYVGPRASAPPATSSGGIELPLVEAGQRG